MAGSKSDYLELKVLDHILGGGDYTRPATVYLALFTATPSDTGGGTECTGSNYARLAITNNATNWPAASAGSKKNGVYFLFPIPTGTWGTVTAIGIFDAATSGNLLFWSTITSKSVTTGVPVYFAVDSITITEA